MKILFLTHRLPCPPDRGCKLRSAAILFGLAQQHDVWCAGFLDAETDTESKDRTRQSLVSLRNVCRGAIAQRFRPWQAKFNALRHLITGQTATEGYFASRRFTQRVHRLAQLVPFDAVFAFSSSMAPLALSVPAKRRVLCMDDLDSQKWIELANSSRWPMRHLYNTEARRLGNRELEWIDRFDATLVISQREADLVTDARLRKKIHICPPILPSPISSSTTSVATSITENAATNDRELDVAMTEPIVGFVGAMDYQPNIDAASWLAREIWPHVRQVRPDAKLWIVGRSPTPAVHELAKTDANITITGTVTNVDDYFRKMRTLVAPLRIARGVQMKVIAAMSLARPCIVTPSVADGIAACGISTNTKSSSAQKPWLTAESTDGFVRSILDLLDHPQRAAAIGNAGQRFVQQMQPEQVIRRIEALLSDKNYSSSQNTLDDFDASDAMESASAIESAAVWQDNLEPAFASSDRNL